MACGSLGFQIILSLSLSIIACLNSIARADIVPSHSAIVGLIQSIQDPRYKVEFHPPGSNFQKDPEQETVTMTDADGRKYECVLPQPAERQTFKGESSQQNSSSISLTTERKRPRTPDDLLALLKEQCFFRHEGWWTYEFCYQAKVRQLHVENKKVVQEFVLGVYDADATAKLHQNLPDVSLQKDHRSKSAAQRYHSQLYTNGTMCDLTNEPRETEVRFVCADTGNNMINLMTEASTCKYTLIFHAPVLCNHPLFQEERPQLLVINCLELPPVEEAIEATTEDNEVLITGLLPSPEPEELQ